MLAVLFAARTAMAFQFQSAGAAGPLLVDAFRLEYALLGTLIGLYMLPGIPLALPGGVIGQRYGARGVVLVGLVLMVAGGALAAAAESFAVLCAGRALSGVGAVLINVLMTKMMADWFAGRELVTAMSLFVVSWPLGIALALVVLPPLGVAYGWDAAMTAGAIAAAIGFAGVALVYRDPPGAPKPTAARLSIGLSGREWLLVSLAGFMWMAFNVAHIVLASFTAPYFTTQGYSVAQASWIASLVGWLVIPVVPLSGYLAERLRHPVNIMAAGLASCGIACILVPLTGAPAATFFFVALLYGLPGGIIASLPASVLRPENRAAGMGLFFSWYYIGTALLPGVAGLARDVTGSAGAPLYFAGAMLFLALVGLGFFRAFRRRFSAS